MLNRRMPMTIIGSALVLTLLAAACGGSEASTGGSGASSAAESGGGTIDIQGESANDHGTQDVSGASDTKLEMDDFYFSPTVLTGTAGQTIAIELENEGQAVHNFSIDDQGIDEVVQVGASADVKVTFPDSGEVVFYCKFHRSSGMLGELTVS